MCVYANMVNMSTRLPGTQSRAHYHIVLLSFSVSFSLQLSKMIQRKKQNILNTALIQHIQSVCMCAVHKHVAALYALSFFIACLCHYTLARARMVIKYV